MGSQPQTQDGQLLHSSPPTNDLDEALSEARTEADAAYAAARELVYDRVATGPVDLSALSPEQRQAMLRLDGAEARVREVRRAAREAPPERVIRLDQV